MRILVHDNKTDESILRTATKPFDFNAYTKEELRALIKDMRVTMQTVHGVGLSANQVGYDFSMFVAQVEDKFYAIFNPEIVKLLGEVDLEEGCLSVPNKYGVIQRAERVTLTGFDQNQKKLKINAWGLLAQVFQHEVGHLHGELFIDSAREVYTIAPSDTHS
jgi:peptide deformylase